MSSAAVAAGQQIGKYLLGRKLGEGGFGVVFLAQDTSLDRELALKFLNPEHTSTPQIVQRFLREARSAAKISHPGIVTVFECSQVNDPASPAHGAAYIAMELLHGESLTARLSRSRRLNAAAAMEIGRQVAAALDAAHRAGIVHRDLKPDNIFLVPDSAVPTGERVKVLDFGIAKLGSDAARGDVTTQSMMVFGTPRYMSPEQCKSAAHVDHRSDIYTLGCILFELVCGVPPFQGTAGELIALHQLVAPPSVLSLAAETPPHLAALIAKMLAKEPDARPQSMAIVQRELDAGATLAAGLAPTLAPRAALAPSLPSAAPVASADVRPAVAARPPSAAEGPVDSPSAPPSGGAARSGEAGPVDTFYPATFAPVGPGVARRGWLWPMVMIAAITIVGGGAWWFGFRAHSDEGDDQGSTERAASPTPKRDDTTVKKSEPAPEAPPASATPSTVAAPAASSTPASATPSSPTPAAGSGTTTRPAASATRKAMAYGVLSVSTVPACSVAIDGGSAHQTPLRAPLTPGRHTVVLSASDVGYTESVAVDIRAGQTTPLVRKIAKPPEVAAPPSPNKDATINPYAHKQ